MPYILRVKDCQRSLFHIQRKSRPFKRETHKLSGSAPPLSNDKCSVSSSYMHTNTHPLSVTLPDKHAHTLTLVLISPVSLQWAHCSATLLSSPLLATLRIIEYRSLAFAAVCKRVCLWMSVCLTGALQGHRHSNLSMGSFRCAVTEHRSQGSHE